jgi:hypothetical protein
LTAQRAPTTSSADREMIPSSLAQAATRCGAAQAMTRLMAVTARTRRIIPISALPRQSPPRGNRRQASR